MQNKLLKFLTAVALILAASNGYVWHAVYIEEARQKSTLLTVAFLDVGQGDAIFIEAPNGNQVLVDAGPNAKVLSELGKVMPWYDKSIDTIVVTNPDKDHIAGFIDVLKRFEVQSVIEPTTENKTLVNTTLQELITENGLVTYEARRGMEITLDKERGITMTILFPDRDVSARSSNDGSVVMRLVYGETEVMLTGDSTVQVEEEILAYGTTTIQSDILKVGHHGSKTSSSKEFLAALQPQFSVISLGRENKYGHPHAQVIDVLQGANTEILRTDESGTIIFKSDGAQFVREK